MMGMSDRSRRLRVKGVFVVPIYGRGKIRGSSRSSESSSSSHRRSGSGSRKALDTLTNQAATPRHRPRTGFTEWQGQHLEFNHAYTKINGRPPAEADMQRHFGVAPPTVRQMVFNLDRAQLIECMPGKPRSFRVLVDPDGLPTILK